jgi:hypothetical protein
MGVVVVMELKFVYVFAEAVIGFFVTEDGQGKQPGLKYYDSVHDGGNVSYGPEQLMKKRFLCY